MLEEIGSFDAKTKLPEIPACCIISQICLVAWQRFQRPKQDFRTAIFALLSLPDAMNEI